MPISKLQSPRRGTQGVKKLTKKVGAPKRSKLEEELYLRMRLAGLPAPVEEYRFHPVRRWRFDMAFINERLAIEIEGGTYINGRHQRPSGFAEDCIKYNSAIELGWRVLRFTGDHIKSGYAVATIKVLLERL